MRRKFVLVLLVTALVMGFAMDGAFALDLKEFVKMCERGDVAGVKKLLKSGESPNAADKDGKTLLMYAVERASNTAVITALAEAGADVNAKDKEGWPVLFFAAATNPTVEIINALVKSGVNVNAKDSNGATALMGAAFSTLTLR